MKLIEFNVELQGSHDVTVNGVAWSNCENAARVDEKLIFKQVDPRIQWFILCELKKLSAKLEDTYNKTRTRLGEITAERYDELKKKGIKPAFKPPLVRRVR